MVCPVDFPLLLPYLWLTGIHFVDKLYTMEQPIRPTQPPMLPGSVNEQTM